MGILLDLWTRRYILKEDIILKKKLNKKMKLGLTETSHNSMRKKRLSNQGYVDHEIQDQ